MSWQSIAPANLDWTTHPSGLPVATHISDIYFSESGALAESQHVFIESSDLPCRFQTSSPSQHHRIGELGFGFGINFLMTVRVFLETAPPDARLLYVSTEKHPVRPDDLRRGLEAFPALARLSGRLMDLYPAPYQGVHPIRFLENRVDLLLLMGDAREMLAQIDTTLDAWFLDGFSPKENPDLWGREVLGEVARLSVPGRTTVATYSVAGHVRGNLADVGFIVEKVPGLGTKKHQLRGVFQGRSDVQSGARLDEERVGSDDPGPLKVAVVGAGFAGLFLAEELLHLGASVTVFEKGAAVGSGTSSIPSAFLFPHLKKGKNPTTDLSIRGYSRLNRLRKDWGLPLRTQGMVQLFEDAAEAGPLRDLFQNGILPPEWATVYDQVPGLDSVSAGIHFHQGGSLRGADVTGKLADRILNQYNGRGQIVCQSEMNELDSLEKEFDHVVIAAGISCRPWTDFEIHRVRGQMDSIFEGVHSDSIPWIWSKKVHITPVTVDESGSRVHFIGATFGARDESIVPHDEDHRKLEADIRENLPFLNFTDQWPLKSSWVGFRPTAPDRLPHLGHLTGKRWLFSGLGSRGLTFGCIGAWVLANRIMGNGVLIERELEQNGLDPRRFDRRRLRKQGIRL